MDKEKKSAVKLMVVALLLMGLVFFGLYKLDQKNSHSHDDGTEHAH